MNFADGRVLLNLSIIYVQFVYWTYIVTCCYICSV